METKDSELIIGLSSEEKNALTHTTRSPMDMDWAPPSLSEIWCAKVIVWVFKNFTKISCVRTLDWRVIQHSSTLVSNAGVLASEGRCASQVSSCDWKDIPPGKIALPGPSVGL